MCDIKDQPKVQWHKKPPQSSHSALTNIKKKGNDMSKKDNQNSPAASGQMEPVVRRTIKKNVNLDAALVLAAMQGGIDKFMFAARQLGLTPNEAMARSDWLKKQKENYITEVSKKAAELESA